MSRTRVVLVGVGVATATAVVAGGAVAVRTLRDEDHRARLTRSARVWRLSTRRAAHYAVVKVRGVTKDEQARAALEEQFAIRSAEDVAAVLGNMKGAIMKLGQMVSFVAEGLPEEAQRALATLQADVPPMAPSLAEQLVLDELGRHPSDLFLDWSPVPVAAASVGQVHRAVLHDGRVVAVKVQYPGIAAAIRHDLDNVELLYALMAAMSLKGLDVKGLVDELRDRMADELDYRIEAANQTEFCRLYEHHPFIRIPAVVPELSSEKVLTSEWIEGATWAEFEATASAAIKQRAGEVVFRFAQGSIHRYGVFNGDPHPGNYRFHRDGSVTFLDFGLVKRWTGSEWDRLSPCLDAIIIDRDAVELVRTMEDVGFLRLGHGLEPEAVYGYVSSPYVPYLTDTFTFTRDWMRDTLTRIFDIQGPDQPVITALNLPPSFVILDRVVWGVSALLARLEATGPWRSILLEYRRGGAPATELGRLDAEWRARRP